MAELLDIAANTVTVCGAVCGCIFVVCRFARRIRITVVSDDEL